MRQAFWLLNLLDTATRMPPLHSRDVMVATGAFDLMTTPAACRERRPPDPSRSRVDVIAGAGHMLILQEDGVEVLTRRIHAVLDRRAHEGD